MVSLTQTARNLIQKPFNPIRLFTGKLPAPIILRNLDDVVENRIEVRVKYAHPHFEARQWDGYVQGYRVTKYGLEFKVCIYKLPIARWIAEPDVLEVLTANVRIEAE